MLLPLFLLLITPKPENTMPNPVRELVFQAEVYGTWEESLNSLRYMLSLQSETDSRAPIIRAISMVKMGLNPDLIQTRPPNTLKRMEQPTALIKHENLAWLLVDDLWLELGDWVDSYFILDIRNDSILLESRDGAQSNVIIRNRRNPPKNYHAALDQAEAVNILPFLADRVRLNSFVPSAIDQKISGYYKITDWLSFLDQICSESSIVWTRRTGNVIFNAGESTTLPMAQPAVRTLDSRKQDLTAFLQNLAETFEMELVLEGDLDDIQVAIRIQDQPWDQVLDCLSVYGITWAVDQSPERPRLFIQKDRE